MTINVSRPGLQVTMGDGAKRAIESIVPGDSVLSNYGGGDLRPARVTECFAKRRQGQLVCVHLRSGAVVKSTPEHVHFAGYVLGETPQTYFLYLMHKEGVGYRLGTSQVYTEGQAGPWWASSSAPSRSMRTRCGSSAPMPARTKRASTRW